MSPEARRLFFGPAKSAPVFEMSVYGDLRGSTAEISIVESRLGLFPSRGSGAFSLRAARLRRTNLGYLQCSRHGRSTGDPFSDAPGPDTGQNRGFADSVYCSLGLAAIRPHADVFSSAGGWKFATGGAAIYFLRNLAGLSRVKRPVKPADAASVGPETGCNRGRR